MLKLNSVFPTGKQGSTRHVQYMLNFLPADKWHLVLKPISDECEGAVETREYTKAAFRESVSFLRGKNGHENCHIIGRPASNRHVLIDDLSRESLQHLEDDDLTPNLIVETSPENYQAWLTISGENVTDALATATARLLAIRYDGDEGSAHANHAGRIAGFRNRKPKYRDANGGYPLVQVVYKRHGIANGVAELLREAAQEQQKAPPALLPDCAVSLQTLVSDVSMTREEAIAIYESAYDELLQISEKFNTIDAIGDRSRIDFHMAMTLLRRHHLEFDDVVFIIWCCSEKARKRGVEYVYKTVQRAYEISLASKYKSSIMPYKQLVM